MSDPKDRRAEADTKPVVSVPSPRALSGARELQRQSERPTMPPVMPSIPSMHSMPTPTMPIMTNPPVSQEREIEREKGAEDDEEIPELLRSVSARAPVRVPSNRPPPNVTRITPAKKAENAGGVAEEVVVNRKDRRRED